MSSPDADPKQSHVLRAVVCLGASALVVQSYLSIGHGFYRDYALGAGGGMGFMLPDEIAFFALNVIFGLLAAVLLSIALSSTRLGDALGRLLQAMARRPGIVSAVVGGGVTLVCWLLARYALGNAAITDDEHVFHFIAQTLRTGHLTARSPGTDLAFFREQFVVLTPAVRFGKYPIGFPVLLAIGQVLGAERWVVPGLTGALAGCLYWIGQRAFGAVVTTGALLLFATSPQVLVTGATTLSQPASALFLLVAVGALLEGERRSSSWAWMALGGCALGLGVLVRPFPGVLFVAAAVVHLVARRSRPGLIPLAGLLTPVAAAAGLFLLINRLQLGSALSSGYLAVHSAVEDPGQISGARRLLSLIGGGLDSQAMSLFAGIFRLNLWLFAWPLSLLLLPFARRRETALLWWMVAGELTYRLLAPKAGVGSAGPIYLYEIVPLLCLLSADGAAQLARQGFLGRVIPRSMIISFAAASTLVGWTTFVPARLEDLWRMGIAQNAAPELIAERGLHQALVFHEGVVPPQLQASWAYYPRCNGPNLDDDVLYVLYQRQGDPRSNLEFWHRRYPDRSAWYFRWSPGGEPELVELEAYVAEQLANPSKE